MPREPKNSRAERPPEVDRPYKGLHMDSSPIDQPEGTYRFALNAVVETESGAEHFLSNEGSNEVCTAFPAGYIVIGDRYLENNTTVLWSVNPTSNRSQIGILNRDGKYTAIVDSAALGFDVSKQIDTEYRLRRGNERVVYWVDGLHRPRVFNLDRVEQYYSTSFSNWIKAGNNLNLFTGERWDSSAFDLIKTYDTVPRFDKVEVLDYGNMLPGSYSFAIQYLDDNLNPTEWITTSNPVNIFNDSATDRPYYRVRGSRNTQADSQNYGRASKSIKLTLTDLDPNFPFYRIAIIEAVSNNGKPTRALASNVLSIQNPTFIFSGNDGQLAEVSLQDIAIDGEIILAPQHISQIENRLILANTKSSNYDWCTFQKGASKISSDLVTESVILNSALSAPNQKNPESTFTYRGYMPGEVYSFGIAYLMKDGSMSPVFHIPGKHNSVSNDMEYHELDTTYINLHNCLGKNNYYGVDNTNHPLTTTPIRHHKFKNRKDASKPLITNNNTTVTITKYRLFFTPTLASGKSWPVDSGGIPLTIAYSVSYQPSYASSPITYAGYLSIGDLGREVVFYDDLYAPTLLGSGHYFDFDSASELIATYQPIGDNTFVLTKNDNNYTANTITGVATSDIFGISFSGITKPHEDVVGFYIMRNERLDDDRIVVDNAILGNNLKHEQYAAFGLWAPKTEDTKKHKRSTWFFSPEHQFFKKKLPFTNIDVQGYYEEVLPANQTDNLGPVSYSSTDTKSPPIIGYPTNGGIRGVLIPDVYPGTSYNAEVHKKKQKDNDGFSLAIGYRNSNFNFVLAANPLPNLDKVFYMDACANRPDGGTTYYNTSCDNKIGIATYQSDLDLGDFYDAGDDDKSKILYANLTTNNRSSYGDFLTRPYYKEHNNPVMFGNNSTINNHKVFNGDAFISPANLISTVFWEQRIADRDKKDKTWQIVAGAILIVVGVVLALFTGGATLSLTVVGAGVIAALAISYGVSLAMSGIKFEQMKNMIDNDYPKGLKECVKDQASVYSLDGDSGYPGPLSSYPNDTDGATDDDMFMWWSDRISNIWIESTVPYAIRVGLTSGTSDFIDAPNPNFDNKEFENYLTEKLTVLDKDRGSGRLYKGYPTAEIYDANLDYMRFNKEKTFIHLPAEYDCCYNENGNSEIHPMRVWYSEQSFQEEKIDTFRTFLPNSYRDIEGEHGEITDLYRLGSNLYIHTKEALWHLPQNIQERVTGELISFVGTGSFFSIPPKKMVDDDLGSAGTQHKWATQKTSNGVFFVSEVDNKVYLHTGEGIKEIGTGVDSFLRANLKSFLSAQIYDRTGVNLMHDNNPANPNGIGYLSCHDTKYNRILLTKRDYTLVSYYASILKGIVGLPYPADNEQISQQPLESFFAYNLEDGNFYNAATWQDTYGDFHRIISKVNFSDSTYFEDKSFTLSYHIPSNTWVGFHCYMPTYYLHSKSNLYSFKAGLPNIYRHNKEGHYQTFFGQYCPFIIESVAKANPLQTKVWEDVTFHTEARTYDGQLQDWFNRAFLTFNKAVFYNSRQCSGERDLVVKDHETGNYMHNQVVSRASEALITRKEGNWNLNDIRDYRVNYEAPIWDKSWSHVHGSYWVDKVINSSAIDIAKHWTQLEMMRDKYLCARFILNNPSQPNISLTANYILYSEEPSIR